MSDNKRHAEASDHRTAPERLRALAEDECPRVRQAVAANPNAPRDVLFDLASEFPRAFVDNAALPLMLLENPRFIHDMPEDSLCALLELEDVPPEFLDLGARHRSWNVKRMVAAHGQTPGDLLVRLARHYFFFEEVAQNPNTPRSYLEFLVEHPWDSIRLLVARRDKLDADLAEILANDDDAEVRRAAEGRARSEPSGPSLSADQ
jgi:hypothetical protein